MSSIKPSSSKRNAEPEPQQSLPPSPTEQDLGGVSPWVDTTEHEFDTYARPDRFSGGSDGSRGSNGKGKARELSLDEREPNGHWVDSPALDGAYPPSNEEEEESKRIEQVRSAHVHLQSCHSN